jgi:FkbM family methyltransferase
MRFFHRWAYYAGSLFRILFNFENGYVLIPTLFRKGARINQVVSLRKSSLQLVTRGAMDIWSVKETFLDSFYTRYSLPIQDGWTIVDIGAGIGDFSIYAAYQHPKTVVYAYEPFPESFALLTKNIALNKLDNILPFQVAIWGQADTLLLDDSSGEPLQVTSKALSPEDEAGAVKVEAQKLSQVLKLNNIEKIDLLKLDCEGAEYEILLNVSAETFTKIERIIMEYHNLDSVQNHQMLAAFLEKMGYHVSCYKNKVHDHIGYLFAERNQNF